MSSVKIKYNLTPEELKSIKGSFFHIYNTILDEGHISKDYVGCLFKWGVQLHINEHELDLLNAEEDVNKIKEKGVAIEHLYNMVVMIYLDEKVEDVELKVVSEYAEKLGFKPHIVNDLLKNIVTAPYDGWDFKDVKTHIKEILEMERQKPTKQ